MNIDWQLIEAFVRVADAGSLTAAARAMGVSQPTLSRHVQELEEALAVQLFVRHPRGLTLTDRGAELVASARRIDAGVDQLVRQATGLRVEPAGSVRISVNEPLGLHVLPPCFAALRAERPKISLEVVIDNALANLSRRDADIAVRMVRPTQPNLVARRVGQVEVGLFASEAYLSRCPAPRGVEDIARHTLVGFDRDTFWFEAIRAMGLRPDQFAFRTDNMAAQIEAVRAGVGIGAVHLAIAARMPELVRVARWLPLDPLDLWLVVHEDVRGNPAVRVVLEALGEALGRYVGSNGA